MQWIDYKMIVDNIIVGNEIASLKELGVLESETLERFSFDEVTNDQGNVFLPALLVKIGVFKSNSECRNINAQRQKSSKFNKDPDQDLWRNIERPEFTNFKIFGLIFCDAISAARLKPIVRMNSSTSNKSEPNNFASSPFIIA